MTVMNTNRRPGGPKNIELASIYYYLLIIKVIVSYNLRYSYLLLYQYIQANIYAPTNKIAT